MNKLKKILTKQFLIKRYVTNKESTYKIAKEVRCGYTSIYRRLKKYKIKRFEILTKKFLIKEYITNRKSTYQIGKEIDYSYATILRYLKKYNIPIRTISEANKGNFTGKNSNGYIDGRCSKPYYCINCGKKITYHAVACGQGRCHSCAFKGKNHPNWQGGISFEPYPLGWTKTFKEQIRYRDGYRCQICGKSTKKNVKALDIHHIDYNKENLDPKNLISLCHSCHTKTNFDREIYIEYFGILGDILCVY